MRKFVILFAIILCVVHVSLYAAVAFDTSVSIHSNNVDNISLTKSITVANQSNRLIVVCVAIEDPSDVVSTITHDGESLTKIRGETFDTWGRVEMWYRLAPNTGAGDIVATLDNTCTVWGFEAMSFYDVDQLSPEQNEFAFVEDTDTISDTITPDTANSLIVGSILSGEPFIPITPNSGQTVAEEYDCLTWFAGACTYEIIDGSGEETQSITGSDSVNRIGQILASFAPYSAAAPAVEKRIPQIW